MKTPKERTHIIFGTLTVIDERDTTGGNRVYVTTSADGIQRVILTDKRYWTQHGTRFGWQC